MCRWWGVGHPVELVEDLRLLDLVDLVEDHDVGVVVGLPDAAEEFVVPDRIRADVCGRAHTLGELVEERGGGVVPPAVNVLPADVRRLLVESVEAVTRETGFPTPDGPKMCVCPPVPLLTTGPSAAERPSRGPVAMDQIGRDEGLDVEDPLSSIIEWL